MNIVARTSPRHPVSVAAGIGLLLTVFYLASLTAAAQKSPTFDESLHLFAGYSYLKWEAFGINPEHPPLAKLYAALPLLASKIDTSGIIVSPASIIDGGINLALTLASRFVLANGAAENIFLYPRSMMIALASVLGLFVFLWARELYGNAAGLFALITYCFDPNFLAHSSVIHTDVPFTLCFFAATFFFWRAIRVLTWKDLALTSLFYGMSAVVKFSFIAILPVWLVLGILLTFSSRPLENRITSPRFVDLPRQKLTLVLVIISVSAVVAYGTVWAAYGFHFDAFHGTTDQLRVGRLVTRGSWLSELAVLNAKYFVFPEAWLYGVLDAIRASDRSSYLLGKIYSHGSWLYFPVAFAVKTPLPTLIALLVAAMLVFRSRSSWSEESFLLIPAIMFFAIASCSNLNIGIRHILPVYPFLFVLIGGGVSKIWSSRFRIGRVCVILLGIWLTLSNLKTYPDYFAFFNEAVGGPNAGHQILIDSNLDWGQDLKGLGEWMHKRAVSKVRLAYFGTVDPACYGIAVDPLPGTLPIFSQARIANPSTATYFAISVTYLHGLYLANPDLYASFLKQQPVTVIGHSIWVFSLKP